MEYAPEHECRAAVERHQAGDSEELGRVAHRIATVLAASWRWYASVEVDDAVQDAVLNVLRRAANYDPAKGKAFAYLSQIVKHSFCHAGRAVRISGERLDIYAEHRHREAGGRGRVRRAGPEED